MTPHICSRRSAGFCYTLQMVRDLSPYKILVVDDEADVRAFIGAVLADNGATVLEASDGDAALEVARREKPDLITLDITMPGKDGAEVFEALRKDPALLNTPVCIISAHPDLRRLIYQRTVPPPDGYLDKPIDEKGLLLNVRKTLTLARRGR
jgi:CheY-like chemotaxis protein